jgi:hypothetical protein
MSSRAAFASGGTPPSRNREPMPNQESYRVLEYPFRVQWNDQRLGELLQGFLGWFRTDQRDGPTYRLTHSARNGTSLGYLNGRRFHQATSIGGLLNRFLWKVNSEAIRRTNLVPLVHSAAASWKGIGVLLPAPADSGKTTLVAGLVRAGFSYLTDEAAPIDPVRSWVIPYPKPLSMESASIKAIRGLAVNLPPEYRLGTTIQYQVRPSDLRRRSIGRACPVALVVAPKYESRHVTRLDPISRAEALTLLAQNSLNLARFGSRDGLATLARAVQRAKCYRLQMADLNEAVRLILELVGAQSSGSYDTVGESIR